jgi:glucose/arabinose dehydrogenase
VGGTVRTKVSTILALLPLLPLVTPASADPPGRDQLLNQHFEIKAEDLPAPTAMNAPYLDNAPRKVPRGDALPIVPDGFTVTLFVENLPHPRRIEVLPDGTVLVVQQGTGQVIALRDDDGDGVAETGGIFASGFNAPFGIALDSAGDLLLADIGAVWRIPVVSGGDIAQVTPTGAFGDPSGHITRSLALDPTGGIFVGVGSMSNMSDGEPEMKATIQLFAADGAKRGAFATGIRNATGLRVHPQTSELYAVVMERDTMGEDLVPDFFTRVSSGDDFGWPHQFNGGVVQPGFTDGSSKRAASQIPDVLFEAHSAPMDLIFLPDTWPEEYRGDAMVALKGSSNRAMPTGYKLVRIPFGDDGRPTGGYDNFMTGFWLRGTSPAEVWGRPAALGLMPDGGLLVADDFAGSVWKVMPPAP